MSEEQEGGFPNLSYCSVLSLDLLSCGLSYPYSPLPAPYFRDSSLPFTALLLFHYLLPLHSFSLQGLTVPYLALITGFISFMSLLVSYSGAFSRLSLLT